MLFSSSPNYQVSSQGKVLTPRVVTSLPVGVSYLHVVVVVF